MLKQTVEPVFRHGSLDEAPIFLDKLDLERRSQRFPRRICSGAKCHRNVKQTSEPH